MSDTVFNISAEEFNQFANELRKAVNELTAAAETIKQPFFAAQIGESLARAHIRSQSPWLSREDAAAYAGTSVTAIDQAAITGLIRRYTIGNRVLLKKTEIDSAIESGKWPMQTRKAA